MSNLVAARADQQTARTYWTMGRRNSEDLFRAAIAHSRKIRVLRIALPAAVAVVFISFSLWTWLNPMRLLLNKIPDSIGDLVISGTKITMQAPRLTGYTRDGRPYEVTAKAAAQDLKRPDVVELGELRGKFQLEDDSTIEVTAPTGIYNSKAETLTLGKDTLVVFSSGYRVSLDDAVIEIRTNNMTTKKPVSVEMLEGRLDAKELKVTESGAVLKFDGGVKMKVTIDGPQGAGSGPQGAGRR